MLLLETRFIVSSTLLTCDPVEESQPQPDGATPLKKTRLVTGTLIVPVYQVLAEMSSPTLPTFDNLNIRSYTWR